MLAAAVPLFQAVAADLLRVVVERVVAARQEGAELAHPLGRDPRGGQVRHAAGGQLDPGVGDVHPRREHAMPVARTSATGLGSSACRIWRSWIIRSRTTSTSRLRGEKTPRRCTSTKRGGTPTPEQRLHRRVVELDVADRQDPVRLRAPRAGGRPRRGSAAIGFSTRTWMPRREQRAADLGVGHRGGGHHRGVDLVRPGRRAGRRRACRARRPSPRRPRAGIVDPDQLGAGQRGAGCARGSGPWRRCPTTPIAQAV